MRPVTGGAFRSVLATTILVTAAMTTLSSCQLGEAPTPMHFGFRMEGDDIVVAHPICPSESVSAAKIVVSVDGEGDGDGFETLWNADGPRSEAVRRGVFVVGSARSFGTEKKPLTKRLPKGFYVGVTVLDQEGHEKFEDDDWIDVPTTRAAKPADDQYRTHGGKIMTRDQINAQRRCSQKKG